ncbi:unnamed protein product [Coregonus sp. 'balchen']|nr:unnamed protein product [Coregonus sp. 'balchen']
MTGEGGRGEKEIDEERGEPGSASDRLGETDRQANKLRTKTLKNTLNPVWSETLMYHGITAIDMTTKTLRPTQKLGRARKGRREWKGCQKEGIKVGRASEGCQEKGGVEEGRQPGKEGGCQERGKSERDAKKEGIDEDRQGKGKGEENRRENWGSKKEGIEVEKEREQAKRNHRGQTGRQADRQDRQTDRQTDRQSGQTDRGRILVSLCYSPEKSCLLVGIVRCAHLAAMDSNGYSDPFVKM